MEITTSQSNSYYYQSRFFQRHTYSKRTNMKPRILKKHSPRRKSIEKRTKRHKREDERGQIKGEMMTIFIFIIGVKRIKRSAKDKPSTSPFIRISNDIIQHTTRKENVIKEMTMVRNHFPYSKGNRSSGGHIKGKDANTYSPRDDLENRVTTTLRGWPTRLKGARKSVRHPIPLWVGGRRSNIPSFITE